MITWSRVKRGNRVGDGNEQESPIISPLPSPRAVRRDKKPRKNRNRTSERDDSSLGVICGKVTSPPPYHVNSNNPLRFAFFLVVVLQLGF